MSKHIVPINLKKYVILTPDVTKSEIEKELRDNIEWIISEQQSYYTASAPQLIQQVLDGSLSLKGSVNSTGRALGIGPFVKAPYQPYNLAEMFRAVIVSKLGLLVQQEALVDIIANVDNPTVDNVQSEYKARYHSLSRLPSQYVKRTIERIVNKGILDGLPSPSGILPFWACDTHYSKLKRDGRKLFFSFKIQHKGMVTLEFTLPASARFEGDKVSRPTVYLNRKNELIFGFTIQKPLPVSRVPVSIMGVDLGRKVPFVATIVTKGGAYSQPIIPGKRINVLSKKIERLEHLGALLFAKEELNEKNEHPDKALILKIERGRVRSKKSRLKIERAHHVARSLTTTAQQYNALIALENLTWVPNSKWEQSITSTAIEDSARIRGVKVRKINPKNTSQECVHCGSQVTHSARSTRCSKCARTLDRDILASRNIAIRAGAFLIKQSPLLTRVMVPVNPGPLTIHVPLIARLVT